MAAQLVYAHSFETDGRQSVQCQIGPNDQSIVMKTWFDEVATLDGCHGPVQRNVGSINMSKDQ